MLLCNLTPVSYEGRFVLQKRLPNYLEVHILLHGIHLILHIHCRDIPDKPLSNNHTFERFVKDEDEQIHTVMKASPCLTHHWRGHPTQRAPTMQLFEGAKMSSVSGSMLNPKAGGKAA